MPGSCICKDVSGLRLDNSIFRCLYQEYKTEYKNFCNITAHPYSPVVLIVRQYEYQDALFTKYSVPCLNEFIEANEDWLKMLRIVVVINENGVIIKIFDVEYERARYNLYTVEEFEPLEMWELDNPLDKVD